MQYTLLSFIYFDSHIIFFNKAINQKISLLERVEIYNIFILYAIQMYVQ